ncbi:MAG: DUF5132 domain-containing protein [Chroococcidiopsidaceae cyanobacterium CP_BM_ER_R8_30]|nr:DUF5132 domain-containing protein [Chroococcidiopsidaceae cyanobacterium CP_BM_ER_R8_30]
MEILELLFFEQPLTALAVVAGAVVVAPILGAAGTLAGKDTAVGESLSESSRNLAKAGIIWGMDILDKTQGVVAEAGESFQDLVAEARADRATAKTKTPHTPPQGVTIE